MPFSTLRLSLTGALLIALVPLTGAAAETPAGIPARAADNPPTKAPAAGPDARTLDAIVVTAEREPGNFIIDREDIELTEASDLSGLFSHQSGVAVGGGAAVAQKLYVRGFEDTMLNVTVDGAQQPAELYHHQSRVQIEPEFIKSIELNAGSGIATDGPGALTGALRVVTRNAFDMLQPGRDAGMLVKGAAGFNGQDSHKGVVAGYARLADGLGAMAMLVRQDAGDYEDGNGRRVAHTGFDHEHGQFKLSGLFGAHDFDLSVERLDDTGTYYERPNFTNFNGGFQLSDHQMQRRTVSYNHRYAPGSQAVDVRATAYRNVSSFDNRRNNTGLLYGFGEQSSTGIDLRNTARWQALELTYGVDYRRDQLDATQQATPRPFWGSTGQHAGIAGAYVQGGWKPAAAWRLSAGLRWDDYDQRVDSGAGAGAGNSGSGFSPNLALEWRPLDALTLRAAYSEAFRGVTIREAFFSALYVHHGDLKPERADNVELGLAYERAGYFLHATAFRQHIDDLIAPVYSGGAEWGRWGNIGRAQVDGYEIEAGKRWDRLSVRIGVWNSENEFDRRPLNDADLGLGTSIGRTWTARIDWQPTSAQARYGVRARMVEKEANSISPTAPDKPGYAVMDAMASWSPLANQQLQLGLSINNLFDRFYYDHATYSYNPNVGANIGFPARGRELAASVSWRY